MEGGSQLSQTKQLQELRARIRKLDAIFTNGHANWWQAFRNGFFTYWLPYYFNNDEVALYEAVLARIGDLINGKLTEAAARTAEIKKRLEILEAELKEARVQLGAQESVNDSLQNIASRNRAMPERLVKIRDRERHNDRTVDYTQVV